MAQWKETLEPYVKVIERVKTAAINPVAGEDLIIGAVIISDAGPSTPTLVTSQSEFLSTFASQDLTKEYVDSINKLYKGDDSTMASNIWLNAYRLAGSANMLVVRASKAKDLFFSKSLIKGDNNDYLLKDGQLMKKIGTPVKFVIDKAKDSAAHTTDGWAISINGVGVIGNRNTDEGSMYDYYVQNLEELVDYLNDTPKFFSPSYKFYSDEEAKHEATIPSEAVSVVFEELYLGSMVLDTDDTRCEKGLSYLVVCEEEATAEDIKGSQKTLDLNSVTYSNFKEPKYYATNNYNSCTDLKLRIRRFNHDAVVTKELSENSANAGGDSPYVVLTNVLDVFSKTENKESIEERDFYEVAVLDPSLDKEALYFNLGNILGRGDIDEATLNESLKMIQVQLPDNLSDLKLGYYGYLGDKVAGWAKVSKQVAEGAGNYKEANNYDSFKELEQSETKTDSNVASVGKKVAEYYKCVDSDQSSETITPAWEKITLSNDIADAKKNIKYVEESLETLEAHIVKPAVGEIAKTGEDVEGLYYQYKGTGLKPEEAPAEEIYIDLTINPEKSHVLDVSDTDMVKALDLIAQDEVYVTEGLTDLGNTVPMFQTAMANMAVNENYFYTVSTVNSTNYLSIANSVNRISQDSRKLYVSAPWDIDTGTVGFKYYASPSVIYWEAVCRNKSLNREFASVFGFNATGIVPYQKPVTEFNKRQRQLLLSKRINTVLWDTQGQSWNMNDCYTKQIENNIMSEDGNSRLAIRISKAMPILCHQFIGKKISESLYFDMEAVIKYWFINTIMPMQFSIDSYKITIGDLEKNNDEARRANKVYVLVEVRYQRSLKYVVVYNDALDMGMKFNGQI